MTDDDWVKLKYLLYIFYLLNSFRFCVISKIIEKIKQNFTIFFKEGLIN